MEPANLITSNEVFTITFSESVENHVGMQQIGSKLEKGFSIEELEKIKLKFEKENVKCELINLNKYLPANVVNVGEASILVIRNGVSILSDKRKIEEELYKQKEMVDKKALMRKKVVNKKARWNLCYADYEQEPDYENGKGRVLNFSNLPYISMIRKNLGKYISFDNLYAELNYYYDINKCGIGFHGDTERKLVVGIRLGGSLDLHYQWYHKFEPVGERCKVPLHGGDVYIMSDKAVGYDWKKSSIYTLRHATGSQYTK